MIRYLKVPVLTIAALTLAASPLLAAQDGQAQQQGKGAQMSQQGKSSQQQQGKSAQASGQILDRKEVGFKDTDKTNTVVMMKMQDGRRVAVDLGPTQNLKGIDVKKDQNANVEGRWARVVPPSGIAGAGGIRSR